MAVVLLMFSGMILKSGLVSEDFPYTIYLASSGKMVMNDDSDNVNESVVV